MAKPRVFISSTYYDMRSVRDDLDRFVKNLGYEPVRHESGQVSYGKEESPEQYAYREIDLCEVLICIIGGRFGSNASGTSSSITHKELKTAIDRGKQVYIFVEDNVLHEHKYFLVNKGVEGIKYTAVDNVKIHEFLEEINALPRGNPIFPFSLSSDISQILQDQLAGLFQRLLTEHASKQQTILIEELQRSLDTVGQLVKFLSEQNNTNKKAVDEILFSNHPVFDAVRKLLSNRYRLYFSNLKEFSEWIENARSYEFNTSESPFDYNYYEWNKNIALKDKKEFLTLKLEKSLFDKDGQLKPMSPTAWRDDYVYFERKDVTKKSGKFDDFEDDIPF